LESAVRLKLVPDRGTERGKAVVDVIPDGSGPSVKVGVSEALGFIAVTKTVRELPGIIEGIGGAKVREADGGGGVVEPPEPPPHPVSVRSREKLRVKTAVDSDIRCVFAAL
jgi:hypothetical protein